MMLPKIHQCIVLLAFAAFAVALPFSVSAAEDAKDDKDQTILKGVWVQKGGEVKIEFSGKDGLKIYPHGDNEVIVIICKYTAKKDGPLKVKITEFTGKEEAKQKIKEKISEGFEFSFAWKVQDDIATLEDVKGENTEIFKSHLQAKYEPKN